MALDLLLAQPGWPSPAQLQATVAPLLDARDTPSLPTLATLLLHPTLGPVASASACALLPHILPDHVPGLASGLSGLQHCPSPREWEPWTLADARRLLALPWGPDAAWLLWHHANGRIRQCALENARVHPGHLAHLLWRVTDHVPAVREAAADRVAPLLTRATHAELQPTVPLVLRIGTRARAQHPVFTAWHARWSEPAAHPVLTALLSSASRAARRFASQHLLLQSTSIPVLTACLHSADVVVRRLALERLHALDPEAAGPVFRALFRSAHARTRREALAWLVDHGAADAPSLVRHALDDRDAQVRALAQWHCEGTDPADHYRSLLAHRPALAALGLGQCGAVSDATHLLPLLAHREPHVRSAALTALTALDADTAEPHLVAALADPALPVVTLAANILTRLRRFPPPARLWRTVMGAPSTAVQRVLLPLAARGSHWPALGVLLKARVSVDAALAALSEPLLQRWLARADRVFTRPTLEERAELGALVNHPALPPGLARAVRAWVEDA